MSKRSNQPGTLQSGAAKPRAAKTKEVKSRAAKAEGAKPAVTTIDEPELPLAQRVKNGIKIVATLFLLAIAWLLLTAPLSRSLQPSGAPGLVILSAEGEPIARRGAVIEAPVDVEQLPDHVGQAFVAVEDRRFYTHLGIDPYGIGRAMVRNLRALRVREGGSTISQQLAKTSFLSPERTAARKIQEALIAVWLEVWLSKEEILSRYLSNVYFGDNVYGLRAAARHYFNIEPEELTLAQSTMLAGLVNAPTRLAPTNNLEGAQRRSRLVMREMQQEGLVSEDEVENFRPARLRRGPRQRDVPTGTYFADWVVPQAAELAEAEYGERQVQTTLEGNLQRIAARAVRRAGLGRAQAALVAMRLDGRVVAMVGGRDYRRSAFNRATQARRQPGSAFKPFVYFAAFRAGYTPLTPVNDMPIRLGSWQPRNYDDRYRGRIRVRDAVAISANSVAVQVQERVGRDRVIEAARDLGITTRLDPTPSLALGVNGVSLLEMTAAYAAFAAGRYPIRPHGLPREAGNLFGLGREAGPTRRDRAFPMMRDVLYAVVNRGTGRSAALGIPTFGKTGTTSDYRDAWFIGFADGLVVGVWVGRDDNRPMPGTSGGSLPARIWRSFMADALGIRGAAPPPPQVPLSQTDLGLGNEQVATSEIPATAPPPEELPPPGEPEVPEIVAPPPVVEEEAPPPDQIV
ncbi:MAG: transglycosylase domain-containing protein [Sphingosinicella sp.]